jgi:hypothetical protein
MSACDCSSWCRQHRNCFRGGIAVRRHARASYNLMALGDSSVYSTALTELVPQRLLGVAYSLRSPVPARAAPDALDERAQDRPCRQHARDLRATHGGMRRFSLRLRPAGVRRAFPARRVKREAGEWRRISSTQARRCPRNGKSVRVVPRRDPTARAEPLFADRRMGRWATKTDEPGDRPALDLRGSR